MKHHSRGWGMLLNHSLCENKSYPKLWTPGWEELVVPSRLRLLFFSLNWKKSSIMACVFEHSGCSFTPLNHPTWAPMDTSKIQHIELWNSLQKTLVIKGQPVMIWNPSWKPRKSALWAEHPFRSHFIPQGCPQDNSTEEFQPHWEEGGVRNELSHSKENSANFQIMHLECQYVV